MDWNKSKTILIAAFIVVNIFLLAIVFNYNISGNKYGSFEEEFINDVLTKLESKNINVDCDIPTRFYSLPLLEIEFEIIKPENEIIKNFLGENIEVEPDKFIYKNKNNEILEFVNNKLLIYTKRDAIPSEMLDKETVNNQIQNFLAEKEVTIEEYDKVSEYYKNGVYYTIYHKKYENYCIENSYIKIYNDSLGVYKFEIQQVENINAKEGKIEVTVASEALLRLMIYDDINNKTIKDIKLCYYTVEDENWDKIVKTNADPTWKVIFDDNTYHYLVEQE